MAGTDLKTLVFSEADLCENTELKNEVFVYQWNIKNFVTYLDRKYELSSRIFSNYQSGESKWKLMLYPKHLYPKGTMLAACLVNMSEDKKSYGVKYRMWIVSNQGIKNMVSKEKMFKHHLDFDEDILASHKDLINKSLLQDGSLVLRCEMDVLLNDIDLKKFMQYCQSAPVKNNDPMDFNHLPRSTSYDVPNNIAFKSCESKINNNLDQPTNISDKCSYSKVQEFSPEVKDNFAALSNDLEELYLSKIFADVILLCEGSEFVAHKYVLAARSDYFRKILCSGKGMNNNAIEISDMKSPVLEAVLYFMYTGKLRDLTFDFALDLLSATKIFPVGNFQARIIGYLRKTLTVENVTEVLKICEDLNQDELKQVCMRFINTHHSDVVNSAKWQSLLKSNPRVAGEVLLTVASLKNHNIS
ncbi:TD and POZ domain-containing protein 3 [Araneus ventricosus]|uniref:TD and POZ domain-containing protein 3 n=1 Tax=Araneus ventricosus TaxID=182803 RepID=A0A4Y1ZZJ5_ARAVE|nr:TD and POZ domain-containing protein 3 [Araneus ventricosus]